VWAGNTNNGAYPQMNRLNLSQAAMTEFETMCNAVSSWEYNAFNTAYVKDRTRLESYINAVQRLAQIMQVRCSGAAPYLLPDPPKDLTAIPTPWDRSDPDVYPDPRHISIIRWMAAGALMRTGYFMAGNDTRSATVPWATTPQDVKYAQDMEEVCMLWGRRYAATNSYDWGSPRPLNRCSAWDFPLLQFDLFDQRKVVNSALDPAGRPDLTYGITAPVLPTNYTRGYALVGATWPGMHADNYGDIKGSWVMSSAPGGGIDAAHFNLTEAFAAAERCRQIVCWAVDWQSYEDFESAPSGPYDASATPYDSRGRYCDAEIAQHPPDLTLAWTDANRNRTFPRPNVDTSHQQDPANPGTWIDVQAEDLGTAEARRATPDYRAAFFGLWGADRNGNGRFDRGPVPQSARMRAIPVGRWNYYDRRMISALRN
jgi:hypothetical protein